MFCTKCGNPLEENAKFCSKCGNPVQLSAPEAPVYEAPEAPAYEVPEAPAVEAAPAPEVPEAPAVEAAPAPEVPEAPAVVAAPAPEAPAYEVLEAPVYEAPVAPAPEVVPPVYTAAPAEENKLGKIFSLVSMICGIASLVLCWFPVPFMMLTPSMASIALGIVGMIKKGAKGKCITGIILGAIAFFFILIFGVMWTVAMETNYHF